MPERVRALQCGGARRRGGGAEPRGAASERPCPALPWEAAAVDAHRLQDDAELRVSDVVANSSMNRRRRLSGTNSYANELGFDPLDHLISRAANGAAARWLDVCCGTGLALADAADRLATMAPRPDIRLVGVDLVNMFEREGDDAVQLICCPLLDWIPTDSFDLITCVHGMHYLGDKLGALHLMASWLEPDGLLVADFDPTSIRIDGGPPAGRALNRHLRRAGFELDTRRHRIRLQGRRRISLPYHYLGADDAAGPNYTGQPAVHSYYRLAHDASEEPTTG